VLSNSDTATVSWLTFNKGHLSCFTPVGGQDLAVGYISHLLNCFKMFGLSHAVFHYIRNETTQV